MLEYDSSCRNIKRLPADHVNYLHCLARAYQIFKTKHANWNLKHNFGRLMKNPGLISMKFNFSQYLEGYCNVLTVITVTVNYQPQILFTSKLCLLWQIFSLQFSFHLSCAESPFAILFRGFLFILTAVHCLYVFWSSPDWSKHLKPQY